MTFVKSEIKPLKKGADMGSLLRRVKERKKTRRLGEVEVMEQEGYGELEVDSKVEMIRALVPLGLMHVHELLDAEVSELAGERYVRKSETVQGRRHGTNPGTVKLAGQRVPIRVPRVRGRDGEIPLSSYESLSHRGEVDELLRTSIASPCFGAPPRRILARLLIVRAGNSGFAGAPVFLSTNVRSPIAPQ